MRTRILITLLLLTVAAGTSAQIFSQTLDLALPDSIIHADAEWHDMDNDGLLDVVLIARTASHAYLMISRGDTLHVPQVNAIIAVDPFTTFSIDDFNNDNRLDLLISPGVAGHSTVLFRNDGELKFARVDIPMPSFRFLRSGDVDNNGFTDWVVALDESVLIFSGGNANTWLVADTLQIVAEDVEIFDVDRNGVADLFVSGNVNADSSFTGVITNPSLPGCDTIFLARLSGNGTIGHLDGDGAPDILFTADSLGHPIIRGYSVSGGKISMNDLPEIFVMKSFVGDFDLDGGTDVALLGKNTAGDTINILTSSESDFQALPFSHLVDQIIADPEHDGDLDVLQVVRQDSLHVLVLKNIDAVTNEGPSIPGRAVGIDVFGKLFIYWDEGIDDHTASELLTYDVWLSNVSGVTQSSLFDLDNRRRLSAAHGNAGSRNFKFFQEYDANGLNYAIQSVDNSFHTSANLCSGSSVDVCLNVAQEVHVVNACRRTNISLSGPETALWFSFKDGYRTTGSQLVVYPHTADTLFYFDPAEGSCFGLKVFPIIIQDDTVTTFNPPRYACEGSLMEIFPPLSANTVSWSNAAGESLGSSIPLEYLVTSTDTVTVMITNDHCRRIDLTPVAISKPEIQVGAESLKILKGTSAQLIAHGASHYTWEPPYDLSDDKISNPIATPAETTRYTVTGYDSLNCKGEEFVTVEVKETGFIPTLFTPNDDGQNDRLQVLGLSAADNLSFSIFNREGTRVFHTTSLTVAAEGWNGSYHGARQPSGVYYWKVNGVLATGEKLTLNGKESGSVVLVR